MERPVNTLSRAGTASFLALQQAADEKILEAAGTRLKDERLTTKPLPRFPEPAPRKAHWKHVLEEMSWLAKDYERERKWRCNAGRKCSSAAARRAIGITQERSSRAERSQQSTRKLADRVAREVIVFWHKIQKLVQWKDTSALEIKQRAELQRHLDSLVCKTEHFSSALSVMLGNGSKRASSDSVQDSTLKEQRNISAERGNTSASKEHAFLDLEACHNSSVEEYKPNEEEEDWDDTETFDEQVRLEGEILDPSLELQDLHDEAMIPIEDLLNRYRLQQNEDAAERHTDRLTSDTTEHIPNQTQKNSSENRVIKPFLLKHELRDYQQVGLEWLASCHATGVNVMLADEMGLGKTIQTISILAHLACQHGIWGPHLIIVPTSVMVNWEVEFKKWCPAMKILTYFGSQKERKLKRTGWSKPHSFHVCITTYRLAVQDQSIFRRKRWHYLILDEAHMIKNWRSQRWQTLLSFESIHRLLITGTPLQNDVMELWALMHFLMPTLFQSHSEFKSWFSNPLVGMSEGRLAVDRTLVSRLHAVLRPFILRRLKRDVERTLPDKIEHIIKCRLSRRQKRLYDEYMSSQDTVKTLTSSNAMGVMNCLMQLRKVCNHPDLFAGRSIISAFDMLESLHFDSPSLLENCIIRNCGLFFTFNANIRKQCIISGNFEKGTPLILMQHESLVIQQLKLHRTLQYSQRQYYIDASNACTERGMIRYSSALCLDLLQNSTSIVLLDMPNVNFVALKFMFRIPKVRARSPSAPCAQASKLAESAVVLSTLLKSIRNLVVRTQLVFPDSRLVQFDCGKLQALAELLRTLKAGGHKVVIFTQMTKVLDILEKFLNLYSYSYVRLDGTTKPEQRQILMQRFNADPKLFAFILSTRSGGFGINLTGADTVIFYDSDWNPAVDAQAQDRCHRIGQTRQVNIYRLISEDTIEENIFNKALQKRELDELAIQNGNFNLHSLATQGATETAFAREDDTKNSSKQANAEFAEVCSRLRPVERYAMVQLFATYVQLF